MSADDSPHILSEQTALDEGAADESAGAADDGEGPAEGSAGTFHAFWADVVADEIEARDPDEPIVIKGG
ncbi:hypothetical protein DJ68_14945, partial [Halorubrum sp. C3]